MHVPLPQLRKRELCETKHDGYDKCNVYILTACINLCLGFLCCLYEQKDDLHFHSFW